MVSRRLGGNMGRNYINESKWQKEKYSLIKAYIDKDTGDKLREKLTKEKKTIAGWIRENAEKYIRD